MIGPRRSRKRPVSPLVTARLAALGPNLRRERKARGLAMVTLGVKIGITRGALSNLERGAQYPSVPTLLSIAEALDVPVALLL